MKKRRDNYTFLTQAPVPKVIFTMATPTIVSMLVTSLYNMADTFFVGRLNTQATAAVGIVFAFMSLIQAVGFFFGHGSGNYMSRHLGAREPEKARTMSSTGFVYSFCFGLLLMLVGEIWLSDFARMLGSTLTIQPYTEEYLGIVLLGAPLMTASLTINNQMRLQGNALFAMYGIMSGAVINVVLDPVLIFVFHMGVKGAALATVAGQLCSFVILIYMSGQNGGIPITVRNFNRRLHYVKEIFYGGSPSLFRQGLAAFSTVALNVSAGAFGDAAIAGMSIVTRYCFFILAVVIGLGQGFQPLCGFCFGARLYDRVRQGYMYCVKVGTAFLVVCAAVSAVFAEEIVELFRSDAEVVEIGAEALRWQALTFVCLPTIILTNMLMQTIRKPLQANIAAAARSGLYFIPLIIVMPRLMGLMGVVTCQSVSDVLSFATCVPIAMAAFREMRRKQSCTPQGK